MFKIGLLTYREYQDTGYIETSFEGDLTPQQYAKIQNTFCESFYF